MKTILRTVTILPGRFSFKLVEENGIYSVYHSFDGGHGQKNFGTDKAGAVRHLNCQELRVEFYKALVAKRDKLISRITPISNKLGDTRRQINTFIFG